MMAEIILERHIDTGIPGFMVVRLSEGEWGFISTKDRKVIQAGLASEEEATQRAGTQAVRLLVESGCEDGVRIAIQECVRVFSCIPHLENYDRNALVEDIRKSFLHRLEEVGALIQSEIEERQRLEARLSEKTQAIAEEMAKQKERP